MIKETLSKKTSGEDIEAQSRLDEEMRYWGGLVAAMNPSLTSSEADEIGRAVLKYSGEYGLSPRLIVAVIMVESSGRVSAVSPKGAKGLMQVMPFWKKELGIEGTLFDIDTNIGAGAHILAQYINRYGFEEGIARYYRGSLPVSGDAYIGKVQKAMESIG
ncbi:MAG: transglycosylase SLT domain-containing protein [Deltaproteobacteria bacterium]|nr:transglycosylase SLT domain-containing protein [Deltaproteobacteria bacterium]MBZ0219794.1 transglycosylase SLT domain-containing protein [Deltaproteobacteria bacterium]